MKTATRSLLVTALLLLPVAAPTTARAQDDTGRQQPITLIPAAQRLQKDVLLGKSLRIVIEVDKRLARTPKLPPQEATYRKYYDDAGVDMAYALDVRLRATDPDYLVLRCDSGGSYDPQCTFSASQDPEQPGVSIPGTRFVIPGDGCVYSAGEADNMFNARALHCLQDGALKPVKQPFRYAGFRSKALVALTLYADKEKSSIVTTILPGHFVEVLLQDGDDFLLRDGFGLTGWAKLETGSQQATEIERFFFHGD